MENKDRNNTYNYIYILYENEWKIFPAHVFYLTCIEVIRDCLGLASPFSGGIPAYIFGRGPQSIKKSTGRPLTAKFNLRLLATVQLLLSLFSSNFPQRLLFAFFFF